MTSGGESGVAPTLRCYVASPLGFNEAGRWYYRHVYLPELGRLGDLVDPWSFAEPSEIARAERDGALRDLWLSVGQRNLEQIATCDALIAWLDGQEMDSGTAVEVGYAAALGKPCFGLRSDLRLAGERSMAVNLQVEATIVASGGLIARTLTDLVDAVRAFRPAG